MHKYLWFYILTATAIGWICLVLPATAVAAEEGEELVSKYCASCHQAEGEAKSFAPARYSTSQWQRFFDRSKHDRVRKIEVEITVDELQKIVDYLRAHAADSDDPLGDPID